MTSPDLPRLTARGEETRSRILDAATDIVGAQGAGRTSLDDVRNACGTSKSQIYRHFASRDDLLRAVIERQGARILALQHELLLEVTDVEGLRRWADAIVDLQAVFGGVGCPLGTLASELADTDELTRQTLTACFDLWEAEIAGALRRVQANGGLDPHADIDAWAEILLAMLQGGFLLTKTRRSTRPLRLTLRVGLDALPLTVPMEKRPE